MVEPNICADERYQAAVVVAVLCAKMLAQHDIAGLIRAIDLADDLGPAVNPALWMQKRGAMRQDRALLEAAVKLAAIGKELSGE